SSVKAETASCGSNRSSPRAYRWVARWISSRSAVRVSGCVVGRAASVVIDDHAADVLALAHVGEGLVDVLELVGLGDQLVQLELPPLIHVDDERDVELRAGRAVESALEALARHREREQVEVHGLLH